MRVFQGLEEAAGVFGPCALTIGNFDGVHIGHREIFRRVAALARERGWKPSAMTFHPHPTRVVAPERSPPLLSTPEERCRWMAEAGIEQVLIVAFTPDFARQSPEEFIAGVLRQRLDARAVLVGDNFRFGVQHSGDTAELKRLGEKHGLLVEVVPGFTFRGRAVSSSELRRLVREGAVGVAGRLLGRPFAVEGAVVSGRGIGSRHTVPTLNLDSDAEVLPANGVYVTRSVEPDSVRLWPSVSNVGRRPTFGEGPITVESHLLTPLDGEPPRRLRIEFLRRLREEREFPSLEALRAQILKDAARARAFHRRLSRFRTAVILDQGRRK